MGAHMVVSRVNTAPHGVETPTWGSWSQRPTPPARYGPIPGSELLPYIYNSSKPGTRAVTLRVDTAPHGVEAPTPLADC